MKRRELEQELGNAQADNMYLRSSLNTLTAKNIETKEKLRLKELENVKLKNEINSLKFDFDRAEKEFKKKVQEQILERLATIKSCRDLVEYAGDENATHKQKMFHAQRACKILDNAYFRVKKEFNISEFNNNSLPF